MILRIFLFLKDFEPGDLYKKNSHITSGVVGSYKYFLTEKESNMKLIESGHIIPLFFKLIR